jgi:hypothetical protein
MRWYMSSSNLTTISILSNSEVGLNCLQKVSSGRKNTVYLHRRKYCHLAWHIRWCYDSILKMQLHTFLCFSFGIDIGAGSGSYILFLASLGSLIRSSKSLTSAFSIVNDIHKISLVKFSVCIHKDDEPIFPTAMDWLSALQSITLAPKNVSSSFCVLVPVMLSGDYERIVTDKRSFSTFIEFEDLIAGVWPHAVHWKSTYVSEQHIASIFSIEE